MILKKTVYVLLLLCSLDPPKLIQMYFLQKKNRNITNILQSKTNKNSTKNNQLEQLKEDWFLAIIGIFQTILKFSNFLFNLFYIVEFVDI